MYIFSNSLSVSASQPCAFGNCSFPLLTFHDMESSSSGCQINFFFISETEYQLSINSSYKRGQMCSISINLERKSRLIRWIPEVLVWKVSPEVQQRQLWNWSEGCRWSLWHFSSTDDFSPDILIPLLNKDKLVSGWEAHGCLWTRPWFYYVQARQIKDSPNKERLVSQSIEIIDHKLMG